METVTLDLPENLLHEAQAVTGSRSPSEAVEFALRELVRRSRIAGSKNRIGLIDFAFDPTAIRALDRRRQ